MSWFRFRCRFYEVLPLVFFHTFQISHNIIAVDLYHLPCGVWFLIGENFWMLIDFVKKKEKNKRSSNAFTNSSRRSFYLSGLECVQPNRIDVAIQRRKKKSRRKKENVATVNENKVSFVEYSFMNSLCRLAQFISESGK